MFHPFLKLLSNSSFRFVESVCCEGDVHTGVVLTCLGVGYRAVCTCSLGVIVMRRRFYSSMRPLFGKFGLGELLHAFSLAVRGCVKEVM